MIEPVGTDLYIGRQPILNRDQRLVAYELLFRSGQQNAASFSDGRLATATVIRNLLSELSIGDILGSYRGYLNMDEDMLFSDILELLPPASVVLEILETVEPSAAVIERCAALKLQGYTLALDDVIQLTEPYQALLPHIDIVKVDITGTLASQLPALVAKAHRLGKSLLAEKVETREEMQHCHALGFNLFQGYYFARPVIIKGKKLDHSQLSLLRLMNLIVSEATTAELEAVFKEEPGLSLNLLRLTNSVAMGLPLKITSIRHAITLLGHRQLQRWLQLLLYTGGAGKGSNPLLQLAATRARLMELLAERVAPGNTVFGDDAFMTGILSLTPVLFNQPIEEVVSGLTLGSEVQAALCQHEGRHGALLAVTEALENNQFEAIDAVMRWLPELQIGDLGRQLAMALAWASDLEREAA